MKVTIKTIKPPPPKTEKKFILELSELDAARLFDFAYRIPHKQIEALNMEIDLGSVDYDILDAFNKAGFEGNRGILPKGTSK